MTGILFRFRDGSPADATQTNSDALQWMMRRPHGPKTRCMEFTERPWGAGNDCRRFLQRPTSGRMFTSKLCQPSRNAPAWNLQTIRAINTNPIIH